MDDTQQSQTSEAAAAATRKRRSSILKSQRPPRTPFSELEFHVTTPPDTTKSRRVSFSRRTGVAEFITNEATTTWKNFYEEHNKSLESSGNESGANAPRQTIGHLGKRIFDQQFQEVMAVDLFTTNENIRNVSSSFNNVNLTQQLASLECTSGTNLSFPQQKFEMSVVTDHQSKVFDDLAVPTIGEMSGKIDINFSAIQTIGSGQIKDDLDEIQQDLQRARTNIVCGGPFGGRNDMSEYIEVDLNATHVTIPNDVSDMSITDTIQSPKVQHISKNNTVNKSNPKRDWVEDKENIRAYSVCTVPDNPTNERRQTVVYENDTSDISITKAVPINIILPKETKSDKRKTIIYESDVADISVTQAVPVNILIVNKGNEKRKTIIYEKETGDVSVTQAIPTNIILPEAKTVISEDGFGNISITQAVPSVKIISGTSSKIDNLGEEEDTSFVQVKNAKRQTIVYENDEANISETQVIPPNIISSVEIKSKQPVSPVKLEYLSFSNIERTSKRKTIVSDDDLNDVSITQAIPANIIVSKTFEDSHRNNLTNHNHSDVRQLEEDYATKENKDPVQNKRRTIVFDDDRNNISITQAIPANIIVSHTFEIGENAIESNIASEFKYQTNRNIDDTLLDNKLCENKRRTIVFEADNENANMSITEAIPQEKLIKEINKIIIEQNTDLSVADNRTIDIDSQRRPLDMEKDSDNINMSITDSLAREKLLEELNKISLRQNVDHTLLNEIPSDSKRQSVVFEKGDEIADMSITEAIPQEDLLKKLDKTSLQDKIKINLDDSLLDFEKRATFLDKEHKNVNVFINNVPLENLANFTNQTYINNITMSNKEELLENSAKIEIKDNCNTDADMSIDNNETQDLKHEKSFKNNLTLNINKSIICKPNIEVESDIVIETNFISAAEPIPQEKSIKGIKYDLVEAKSMLMELEKSIVDEKLNKSNVKYANRSMNKSVTQDIFVYQAVTNNDLVVKDSSLVDHQTTFAVEEMERKALLLTKSMSKESNIEVDVSVQLSQTTSTNEIINSSSTLKETKMIPPNTSQEAEKSRRTLLDNLLDMSSTSLDNSDKNIETVEDKNANKEENTSSDSLIHVRDSDDETQTERNDRTLKCDKSFLPLEYKEETNLDAFDIKNKLFELKAVSEDIVLPENRDFEKIPSSDMDKSMNRTENREKLDVTKGSKSFKDANDTNELLEMLSDLTDKSRYMKDEEKPKEPIKDTQYPEVNEPRRLSVAPSRLSIVISREDLLNNISMAHAALQRSIEMDESIADSTPEESRPKNTNRVSNEVAKKLHFEDESDSETNANDVKSSPLKKTAFGESEYMKEKVKVIPSYLKDVSDELKCLMNDLVKPNADPMPFHDTRDRTPIREPSTCSTQIQANLITSSQIDIDTETNSVTQSICDVDKQSSPSCVDSKSFCSSIKSPVTEKRIPHKVSFYASPKSPGHSTSERVITFDHLNPLNNVLLAPSDYSNVHKYNPSNETVCEEQQKEPDIANEKENIVTAQYNIENVLISQSSKQSGDFEMITDTQSISNDSKSMHICELKDTKVNTIIAMKGNKELLETSSSLTLVDDALVTNAFDIDLNSATDNSLSNDRKSPVEVIYKKNDRDLDELGNKDSDLISNETEPVKMESNPKKRNYSPTKPDYKCGLTSLDLTPKPVAKVLRISNSPKSCVDLSPKKAEKDVDRMDVDVIEDKRTMKKEKSTSPKLIKPTVTIQHLITDYDVKDEMDQETLNKDIVYALSRSGSSTAPNTIDTEDDKTPDTDSSFTSSKNQDEMQKACSVSKTDTAFSASRLDYRHPINESSRNLSECESSVNVVAKIDMLPFMGSQECAWEAAGIDTWSFRLLHSRLRLSMRLGHCHHNAIRTRVRADTPVLAVTLETIHVDKDNTVATQCVELAAAAMRHFIGQGCARAGAAPALLRRCAGLARLARRWARAMHQARLHLAYRLCGGGLLALKVANVPLRSVWEVTMRLELVVDDAREVPWPRACDVHVTRVVSDVNVTDDEVCRLLAHLPRDWGHAPKAIWKIFRYLKNKTRDEQLLGLT